MTRSVRFTVEGPPVAQPRLAQTWSKKGKRVAYVRKTSGGRSHPVIAYKALVALRCREAMAGRPFEGPLGFRVVFVMPRPARLESGPRVWHGVKPDGDNLVKSWADSLEGIAWIDDCQLVDGSYVKVYAASDEESRTEVVVWEVEKCG